MEEGTLFWAPLPCDAFLTQEPRLQIPFGRWKDGLCQCLKYGVCHAHLWCSFLCPALQMAQIASRTQLTCWGQPGPPPATRNTFYIVAAVMGLYIVVSTLLSVVLAEEEAIYYRHFSYKHNAEQKRLVLVGCLAAAKAITSVFFTGWFVYALCQTRQSIRKIYGIRPVFGSTGGCGCCCKNDDGDDDDDDGCCEDFCCALVCTSCTVAQLARHTGDYETYPSVCCTETGHAPGAPLMV